MKYDEKFLNNLSLLLVDVSNMQKNLDYVLDAAVDAGVVAGHSAGFYDAYSYLIKLGHKKAAQDLKNKLEELYPVLPTFKA